MAEIRTDPAGFIRIWAVFRFWAGGCAPQIPQGDAGRPDYSPAWRSRNE